MRRDDAVAWQSGLEAHRGRPTADMDVQSDDANGHFIKQNWLPNGSCMMAHSR